MPKIFLTSGTSWSGVATDGSNITVECIGGGGGGATAVVAGKAEVRVAHTVAVVVVHPPAGPELAELAEMELS